MTTPKTRRSRTTAKSRERTRQPAASRASEAIPVLIRLPCLTSKTESEVACPAKSEQAEFRATIPIIEPTSAPAVARPVASDREKVVGPPPLDGRQGNTRWIPSRASRNPPWLRFRFPRWAVRAVLAAGLIAVLVLAFSAIRNPPEDRDLDRVAELEARDVLPLPGIPTLQTPPMPLSMTSPPSSASAASSPPSTSAADTGPVADGPQPDPVTGDSDARTTTGPRPPNDSVNAAPDLAATAVHDSKPAADPPSAAEPPAPPTAAAPAQPAAAITPASHPLATEQGAVAETSASDAAVPLTGTPTRGEPPTPARQFTYPETDPATFQYPADYHLRLRGRSEAPAQPFGETGGGGPLFHGPTTNAATGGTWQPSTARLQPRIEPPPVR